MSHRRHNTTQVWNCTICGTKTVHETMSDLPPEKVRIGQGYKRVRMCKQCTRGTIKTVELPLDEVSKQRDELCVARDEIRRLETLVNQHNKRFEAIKQALRKHPN